MPYDLADHLSFCICAERVVLLDLKADRYFCLGPRLEPAFKRWTASAGEFASALDADLLLACGLVVPRRAVAAPASESLLPPATHDLIDTVPSCEVADFVRALVAQFVAAAHLRRRPLVEVLQHCRRQRTVAALASDRARCRARPIAAALERSGLLLGSGDRCLSRALAAMQLCRRRGIGAALVFGIRLNPFAAHSWVQLDDAVLVGDYEQVRLFTPILVVR
jgi:hypothetical protein